MKSGNHPVLTNKAPHNTKMNMDGIAQTTPSAGKEKKKREDGRAQTTPPAGKEKEKEEDGRTHTTPPAGNEKDGRTHTTPPAGNEKDGRAHTTPPAGNEKDGRAHTTPPAGNEKDGRAHTTPPAGNEKDGRAHTTPPAGNEKDGRAHTTPPAGNEKDGKTTNTPPAGKGNEKRKRPFPQPPTDRHLQHSTPKVHIPGETSSEGQISSLEPPPPPIGNQKQQIRKYINPKPPLPPIRNQKQQKGNDLDSRKILETRASSIIMGLKGIIMVAAVVLISSSVEISKAKSCDLEKAVKSISLNYTVSCEYDDITKISTTLRNVGISLLTLNLLCFLLTLLFMLLHQKLKLVCISFPLIGIFSVFMIMKYNDILNSKTSEKDMNYIQLQSAMAIWLEAHYTSDNISSSNEISNSWNKFFIEYDCCAIHQITGTTNDFDSTPWCTTSGTCQATASQIPRTCCKYVSEDDYGSALSDCHSSVTPGTFRSNCMNVIKQLSVVNIEECQLSLLQMSLIIIATLELVATALEIIATIIWIILWALDREKSKKEDTQPICDLNKSKSEKELNLKKVNKKKVETGRINKKNEKLCSLFAVV